MTSRSDPWQASVAEPVAAVDPGMQVEGEVGVECPEHRHGCCGGTRVIARSSASGRICTAVRNDAVPGDRHAAVELIGMSPSCRFSLSSAIVSGMFRIERETAFQGDRQAAAGVQRIEPDAVHGAQVDFCSRGGTCF